MYLLKLLLVILSITSAVSAEQGEENSIRYATVEEAFAALEKNPDAVLTEHEGWKVFNVKEKGVYVLWSFTPPDHPAHPTVVKRSILKKDGELFIDMAALCFSPRILCDSLLEDFKLINENIKQRESAGS